MEHRATDIDPEAKTVATVNKSGLTRMLKYDRLIIGTGAVSTRPPVAALDLPGLFTLRWMEDGFAIQEYAEQYHPGSAIILGSGYIGMEMCDA